MASADLAAQTLLAAYAGNAGNESFMDVLQLSNGRYIVLGVADDLNWLPPTAERIEWANPGIANNQGSGRTCFVLELDPGLRHILRAFSLPAGAAEDFRFAKTTNIPGEATGEVYLSGDTHDSSQGGYFIGKLNANFVQDAPTGFSWVINIKAAAGAYPDIYQPWDVSADGRVVYAYGDSHDYNWSALYRTDPQGQDEVVPNWRVHWKVGGGEYYGAAANFSGGLDGLDFSGIVFKRDGSRCELRSTHADDYNLWQPDGNGGTKKGKWPLDVLFNGPCAPGQSGNTSSGPGYTGYSPPGTFTYGPSSVCIDRRTGAMYIGFNAKSVLPDGQPDFEPAVMAMDASGQLLWWSRLYHEVRPDGTPTVSTPDQYVDALAIDYSGAPETGLLVVGARCHGNNVENLWEGNQIAANPGAGGFQNQFTGSSGNIHISWIGKLRLADGALMHSTYMAELAEGTGGLGAPHPDPNLDGWPNPNAGWPNVNTTYMGKNRLKVSADGSVLVVGTGRRTITTANAYQKMVKPAYGGKSCWNNFVRLYKPDLSAPLYSSLLVGQWDTLTQAGGDNISLFAAVKTDSAIVVVGRHNGTGANMPVTAAPAWGNTAYQSESAVIACLPAANIIRPEDDPSNNAPTANADVSLGGELSLYPNPARSSVCITAVGDVWRGARYRLIGTAGRLLSEGELEGPNHWISLEGLPPGLYGVQVWQADRSATLKVLVIE